MSSILSIVSGLLAVILKVLTSIQENKLKKAGRDEVVIAQLQDDKKASNRADEIDTDVRSADLADLHKRMSKYQRD